MIPINRRCSPLLASAGVVVAIAAFGTRASAADAVLRLRDGDGFEIAGNVTGFDGASYVLETRSFGRLKIEADRYDCAGPGCGAAGKTLRRSAALVVDQQAEAGTSGGNDFTIEGSDATTLSLLPGLIRGYAASTGAASSQLVGPDLKHMRFRITAAPSAGKAGEVSIIDVKRSDNAAALEALANKRAAIALASRAMTEGERSQLERTVPRLREKPYEHVFGLDGLAIVVAPGNPAKTLRVEDVRRIFTGQITDWSRLGLPAGAIQLYASSEKGGAADRLGEIALGTAGGVSLPQGTIRLPDEAQVSDAVARDPRGLAVISLAFLRSARGLDIANACDLVWRPTSFAVKSEEYPLSRRLYLYMPGDAKPELAQGLVAFATSAEGQAAVRDSQLIDQSFEWSRYAEERPRIEAALALNRTTDAERQMLSIVRQTLATSRRLSSTFRFATNSAALDAKARDDLERLARVLKEPGMAGRRLLLVGYTDSDGPFDYNVDLSERRAGSVLAALEKKSGGRVTIATRGFGPVAPVACNVDDKDKFLNRRVEVWMLDEKADAR